MRSFKGISQVLASFSLDSWYVQVLEVFEREEKEDWEAALTVAHDRWIDQ